MTPARYYHHLRREGYKPINAATCTLMHFCKSRDDLYRRGNRIARWLKK